MLLPPTLLLILQHEMSVMSAQFSADGLRIVTSSLDRTAQVWDAQTGEKLGPPFWHDTPVFQAKFSADGRVLLTLGEDGSLQIWDISARRALAEPLRHQIKAFDLSGNDRELVTVSENIVCWWNLGVWSLRPRPVAPQPVRTAS